MVNDFFNGLRIARINIDPGLLVDIEHGREKPKAIPGMNADLRIKANGDFVVLIRCHSTPPLFHTA